jgi:hypothetical protein
MAGRKTFKARFIPKNPGKYIGNFNRVLARSSWEYTLFRWLDSNPAVLRWSSEEFSIAYLSPIDGKVHQYYPDAFVIYQDKTGQLKKEIIEVKPLRETKLVPGASEQDKMVYAVNAAKWKAAGIFAEAQGVKFRIITELSIFRQGSKGKKK